uniref:Hermansky-Pudlak syndrome 3 protein n=1 Tax=Timema cristinae TaxID=61476 RepID=A0A7R9CPF8_TIMCR|nr:unnamed protein product [Timema cristinae]
MVRVISIHHFPSQDIQTCEEPVAVATALPNYLLLALPQHVVEVHNLETAGNVVFTFPTVDQVNHMVHCKTGNYVATLESKFSHQGKGSVYARIYSNWNVCSDYKLKDRPLQPMRARIAGRVTPSCSQSSLDGLEMIELPVKTAPISIACCQVTGNILLSSGNILTIYCFHVRTHDISHLKFIDFAEYDFHFKLSFSPIKLALCENVIVAMGQKHCHLFQFGNVNNLQTSTNVPENKSSNSQQISGDKKKPANFIDWDEIMHMECGNKPDNITPHSSKLNFNSYPIVVSLPSIASERAAGSGVLHQNSPFHVAPQGMALSVILPSHTNSRSEYVTTLNMLQLCLASFPGHVVVQEEFNCLEVLPLYLHQDNKHAVSLLCLVTTQQEGYLYQFFLPVQSDSALQQAACITVYPFTAPVLCIALEPYLLHVLTETGLETYTLKSGHRLATQMENVDNINMACPPCDDPVCLVGLRPFLGVKHLFITQSYLALLACPENPPGTSSDGHQEGSWTLYTLKLPTPTTLYTDIMTVGSVHRWSSPTTYCHLLCEGHIILRTELYMMSQNTKEENKTLLSLYKDSCGLLADFYITCNNEKEWSLATPYYTMSGLTPFEVMERVKNINISVSDLQSHHDRSEKYVQGLMNYLKTCLIKMDYKSEDIPFSLAVPSFAHSLLDIFEKHDPGQVSTLVLRSHLLREYSTDRVLSIMKKELSLRPKPEPSDALALVLLCIQKGSPDQAITVLNSFSPKQLKNILAENYFLMFEGNDAKTRTWGKEETLNFTELSTLLMDTNMEVLARVLVHLTTTTDSAMTLKQVLQAFMEYLPTRISTTGPNPNKVFQMFLEGYFNWLHLNQSEANYDVAHIEALKILVRSYLSDLQTNPFEKTSSSSFETPKSSISTLHFMTSKPFVCLTKRMRLQLTYNHKKEKLSGLFSDLRPRFLNKLPPFVPDSSKRIVPSFKMDDEELTNDYIKYKITLTKLQSLLCWKRLPGVCAVEVYHFLKRHPQLYGNLSLLVLCMPVNEVTNILMEFGPQALLQCAEMCHDLLSLNTQFHGLNAEMIQLSAHEGSHAKKEQVMATSLRFRRLDSFSAFY